MLFQRSGFLKSKANHNQTDSLQIICGVISKIGFFKIESKSQLAIESTPIIVRLFQRSGFLKSKANHNQPVGSQ